MTRKEKKDQAREARQLRQVPVHSAGCASDEEDIRNYIELLIDDCRDALREVEDNAGSHGSILHTALQETLGDMIHVLTKAHGDLSQPNSGKED